MPETGGSLRGMILCAGYGTRLRPLTDLVPKPLLPVGGRALLDLAVAGLDRAGVGPIVVNTHHLGGQVAAHLAARADALRFTLSPEAEILAGIAEVVDTLAALGSEVFLASLPGTSLLPVTAEKRRVSIEAGVTDVDERIAALDALTDRANAALAAAAAGHANVHIVDLHGWAARIATDGIAVGDQVLRPAKFGGLVGLDGIHFTDTGYAVVANVFLQAINAAWGTSFPQVDVAAVLANDPESPAVLAAAGLDACR